MTDGGDATLPRARALIDLGRYAEAEQVLGALLAAAPNDAEIMRTLADVQCDQDKFAAGRQSASRAVALEPEEEWGHRILANALIGLGRRDEAIEAAQRAVQLAPWFWGGHYALARAYRTGKYPLRDHALASAREAVRLAPYSADAHNLVGVCCSDLGRSSDAEQAYREALRLDPHHALALNNLGALSIGKGSLTHASRIFTSALGNDSQLDIVRQNLDVVLLKLIVRLCLVLVGAAGLEGLLVASDATLPVRSVAGVVAIVACGATIRVVLRELPRGSLRWALKVGTRVGSEFALLIFGFPAMLALVGFLAFAPQRPAEQGAGAILPILGRALIFLGIGTVIRTLAAHRRDG